MLLWQLLILIDELKQYAIDLLQKLFDMNFYFYGEFLEERGAFISDKYY